MELKCDVDLGIVTEPQAFDSIPVTMPKLAEVMHQSFVNTPTGPGNSGDIDFSIHVIFSWTQIGRFGFSDREIVSQIGRFFHGKNI